MLLSLHDDSSSGAFSGTPEVPEGSTVHEMPLPPEVAAQMAQNEKDKAKAASSGNTSQAAKSILEKYMKRPRGRAITLSMRQPRKSNSEIRNPKSERRSL